MDTDQRKAEAREAFLALVEEAGLTPPDSVEEDGEEPVFLWDERKLAVVVDCSEGGAEPGLAAGAGGWGQA